MVLNKIRMVVGVISLNESIVAYLQDDLSDSHPSVYFQQYINSQINFNEFTVTDILEKLFIFVTA